MPYYCMLSLFIISHRTSKPEVAGVAILASSQAQAHPRTRPRTTHAYVPAAHQLLTRIQITSAGPTLHIACCVCAVLLFACTMMPAPGPGTCFVGAALTRIRAHACSCPATLSFGAH